MSVRRALAIACRLPAVAVVSIVLGGCVTGTLPTGGRPAGNVSIAPRQARTIAVETSTPRKPVVTTTPRKAVVTSNRPDLDRRMVSIGTKVRVYG